ncbi:MAG: phosphoribosylamine--glycine ligase [Gemmatimonadaceae bacterium]
MKILLLGSGGREHAIAWKLAQDDPSLDLVALPGNPGIAGIGRCRPGNPSDPAAVLSAALEERPELIVIGPEGPLAAGVTDTLEQAGFRVFGPSREAAQLEASKRFAKEIMFEAAVPTASASWHSDVASAKLAVRSLGAPVVIKASGLAGGKGVVVATSIEEADQAIEEMLERHIFGDAGGEVLVEEYMDGEELSVFGITDGDDFLLLLPVQDHKRLEEGDAGPNTGGMGAYAPVSVATADVLRETAESVFTPTLRVMRERGTPFRGLLYAGLMLTTEGVKVVEFNARFGDPETQAILPLLESSLLELLVGASHVGGLAELDPPRWRDAAAVTTVVAAPGYPQTPRQGAPIDLPEALPNVMVFQAGTTCDAENRLRTAGGRVLAVTAIAPRFEDAQLASAEFAARVRFPDRHFRRDIGWRELARRAGAT